MQECLPVESFGFFNEDMTLQNAYINVLHFNHVKLPPHGGFLVRCMNANSGIYTPIIGYMVIQEEDNFNDPLWWFKSLCKLKCFLKTKLLFWLKLNKKMHTWDQLRKCMWEGPTRCSLYENSQKKGVGMGSFVKVYVGGTQKVPIMWEQCREG